MRHQKAGRKFGRNGSHRRAMLRSLATSLVLHNHIETTLPKAKELKRVADKLVTLGKKNSLHARRQAMAYLFEINKSKPGNHQKRTAVHRLFEEIAPRYAERNGGYTRVLRSRIRPGDAAPMAIIEFVEAELQAKPTKTRRKRRVKKPTEETAPVIEAAAEESTDSAESEVENSSAEDSPDSEGQVEEEQKEEESK